MGVSITTKFTINSPVDIEDIKESWETDDVNEALFKEGEALESEFRKILGFDSLVEGATAEIKVQVTETK